MKTFRNAETKINPGTLKPQAASGDAGKRPVIGCVANGGRQHLARQHHGRRRNGFCLGGWGGGVTCLLV